MTSIHTFLVGMTPYAQSVTTGLVLGAIAGGATEPAAVVEAAALAAGRQVFGASTEMGRLLGEARRRLAQDPRGALAFAAERLQWTRQTEKVQTAAREASRAAFVSGWVEAYKARREQWAAGAMRSGGRGA